MIKYFFQKFRLENEKFLLRLISNKEEKIFISADITVGSWARNGSGWGVLTARFIRV